MSDFNKNILACLTNIKGSGSFVSYSHAAFVFPGLEVENVGELSYPINEPQAKALINQAQKAPFGKGSQTIYDNSVRSAWEIDADKLKFSGNRWTAFLNDVLDTVKTDLGIENDHVAAHLYKMLIYEKGDFFLSHKDSEKEKGMFGTLIIALPSKHTGGELEVRFDGKEESIRFDNCSDNFEIPFAAFYADCDHEVKPLTDGYRVCLVYNLVQVKSGENLRIESLEKHVAKVSELLKVEEMNDNIDPKIILLEHQYTPGNFSVESLKLHDRIRAEVLVRGARQAGYYAKMCLVTSYIAGTPAWDEYGSNEDEDAIMEDVYDESLSIDHWLDEGVPPLRDVEFEEKDLLATFELNDGDPIIKEAEGYMGNYGPDLMHWYHYGAVMLWSVKTHETLLLEQNPANQLEWIAYYNESRSQLTKDELSICEEILSGSLESMNRATTPNYNVIVDWMIGCNNETCFDEIGNRLLTIHFLKIDSDHWAKLADFYPVRYLEDLFQHIAQQDSQPTITHLLSILNALSVKESCFSLIANQMKEIPACFSKLNSTLKKEKPLITPQTLRDLLSIESRFPQTKEWVGSMTSLMTEVKDRNYINTTLTGELIAVNSYSELAYQLMRSCRNNLQQRVNNKPEPPSDWSRPVPDTLIKDPTCGFLVAFLQSPDQHVYDYRQKQDKRMALENIIQYVDIDLSTETIRKGSPHVLRLTKTTASYNRQLKQWHEDVNLLEKVILKTDSITEMKGSV